MMPQTRSQYAAEEKASEQQVDTAEQEQEFSGSNIENFLCCLSRKKS
jgi:hypothetical protein